MNWIKNIFRRNGNKIMLQAPRVDILGEDPSLRSKFTLLKVFRANGGTVIETREYDSKTDRENTGLYVIQDNQNLGEELNKILFITALQR